MEYYLTFTACFGIVYRFLYIIGVRVKWNSLKIYPIVVEKQGSVI